MTLDQRCHRLSPLCIRQPNHTSRRHRRVLPQDRFHLRWIDILAAADDDVVAPLHQPEIALVIQIADVAGEEVAIANGFGGGVGVFVITAHHGGASDDDFPFFTGG